ncbi:MAG: pantoate--beta-alanine ligase [Hymenobacteraceae bacterium]|nr:pantoate--beta-alanine ligase [Hymenobacteraceae bacterium]
MHIFTQRADVRAFTAAARAAGQRVGFVPTMGALHTGHLELVHRAGAECDVVVASIFVNPRQFTNPQDLAAYPRLPTEDAALLAGAGCHALFLPDAAEMYPAPPVTTFSFGPLEGVLEGAFRPGHFAGVGLVVAKLLHLVAPHAAWFGQKDLQQVAVIRALVRDLDFDLALEVAPTVREADGLAMSSPNRRLTPAERATAPALYRALSATRTALLHGATVADARAAGTALLAAEPAFQVEYFEAIDAHSLQPLPPADSLPPTETAVVVAAHLGAVRLIDNVLIGPALT